MQQQIRAKRSTIKTGGYVMDPSYQTARAAEEAARDEMVRNGCNKRANANTPQCQMSIARVREATANRKGLEDTIRQARQIGASADEAELTARYDAECRNRAQRQREPAIDPDAAAAAAFATGIFIMNGIPRIGPGPGGPRHR